MENWALLGLTIWVAVLTVVVVLTVRQIALLTLRLEVRSESFSPGDDGLDIGVAIDPSIAAKLPEVRDQRGYVLHVSSSCTQCRELVPQLREFDFESPMVALLTGGGGVADRLVAEFPDAWRVIRDPEAGETVQALEIQSTPFALQIERGIVTGKAYVRTAEDLMRLITSYRESDAAEIAERALALQPIGGERH